MRLRNTVVSHALVSTNAEAYLLFPFRDLRFAFQFREKNGSQREFKQVLFKDQFCLLLNWDEMIHILKISNHECDLSHRFTWKSRHTDGHTRPRPEGQSHGRSDDDLITQSKILRMHGL